MTADRKKHYQNKDLGSSSTMPSKMHINIFYKVQKGQLYFYFYEIYLNNLIPSPGSPFV